MDEDDCVDFAHIDSIRWFISVRKKRRNKSTKKNESRWKLSFSDGHSRRAERPSCYSSSSLDLFLPPHRLIPSTARLRINYMSIERPLIRGIDIHGPPSAPRPDVYSSITLGPRPHASHRDYIIYCVVHGGGSVERREMKRNFKKEEKKNLCLSHNRSTFFCAYGRSSTATSRGLNRNASGFPTIIYFFLFPLLTRFFFCWFGAQEVCLKAPWEDYRLICG